MIALGALRHPVRRIQTTPDAAEYLLAFPSRRHFAALHPGAHSMSLMFNVGIIAMIADLTQPQDARDGGGGHARGRADQHPAPIGLGFAIITVGLRALDPLVFVNITSGCTTLTLALEPVAAGARRGRGARRTPLLRANPDRRAPPAPPS
jgi:hypothetical protein